MYLKLSLFVCYIILLYHVSSQISFSIDPVQYNIFYAVSFDGSNLTNTSSGCIVIGSGVRLRCLNTNGKLVDGDIGPMNSISDNLGEFFAFSRYSVDGIGRITFNFLPATPVSSAVIYFFNSPNNSIGLPMISLYGVGSQPLSYVFDNNDDLRQNDSQLRNVTLNIQQLTSTVQLDFIFNTSIIDWLLISEVKFYNNTRISPPMDAIVFQGGSSLTVTIGPDNLQSSVNLSCTVVNASSFEWQWQYNESIINLPGRSQILIGDATRTSILTINKLRYSDAGNYTCIAKYSLGTLNSTRTISLVTQPVSQLTSSSTIISLSTIVTNLPSISSTSSITSSSILSSSSQTPSPPPSSSNSAIIGGIAGAIIIIIIFLVVVMVILIIIVIICKRKQKPVSDLRSRGSIKYTISQDKELEVSQNQQRNDYAFAKTEDENELTYSVVVKDKEEPPAIPPQNFVNEYDHITPKKDPISFDLEWRKSAPPKLAKVSNLNGYKLVDNPMFRDTDSPVNGYSSLPMPVYSEAVDHPTANGSPIYDQAKTPDDIYSEPQWKKEQNPFEFNLDNPIYEDADNDQPFSFVQSDLYSEGAIYAEPQKLLNPLLNVTQDNINEIKQLGIGQFGEVVLAETVGLSLKDLRMSPSDDDKSVFVQVAVKKMKEDSDPKSWEAFDKEVKFMSQLNHVNVIRLLAVSHSSCTEHFIVMEYMENGDLNQFLLNHHFCSQHPLPSSNQLSPQILLSMCIQIANGMTYLASNNYIHRDLASRNCLVGQNYVIKIGDFGLSRNLYDSVYYRVKGKAKMPIRWMSTECFYGKFSEKSDVWAYGITVWEIYTMGREPPYATLLDQEIIEDALKGPHRMLLPRPPGCPQGVYTVIRKCCWGSKPDERAHFNEIYCQLVEIEKTLDN